MAGIIDQAFSTANTLLNEGRDVYHQQMAESQAATVAGDQLTQQANASNEKANAETAKATAVANIMNTTGSSGTLYQQDLTGQNATFGYNPKTLQQTQQLQNQSEGLAKTSLNQLEQVQGGTRGLSAAGVEAKAQSITTQSNTFQTQLGNTIRTQENNATTAETQASNEASAQYKQEQQYQQAYTDAAAQYTSEANNYAAAAKAEYNASSTYAAEAVNNVLSFEQAALSAMMVGLNATKAFLDTSVANMQNQMATAQLSDAQSARQTTAFVNQELSFNKQQDDQRVQAEKQANSNYSMFINAGVSGNEANQLRKSYV